MAFYGLVMDGYRIGTVDFIDEVVFFMLGCYGYGMDVLNGIVASWYIEHGVYGFVDEED